MNTEQSSFFADDELRGTRARRTDPETSQEADLRLSSARSHCRALLLIHYRHPDGLTDEEAAEYAGLTHPGICWWHRCSDLRAQGLIEWLRHENGKQIKVTGSNNRNVGISRITEAGLLAVRAAR